MAILQSVAQDKVHVRTSKEICFVVSCGSEQDPVAGFCEHGNEPSDSITYGEFLEELSYDNLL